MKRSSFTEEQIIAILREQEAGANIEGKPHAVMFYMAGLGAYVQRMEKVVAGGYEGFELGTSRRSAGSFGTRSAEQSS